jgi:phosphate starvation-inducible protein PhoH and related proteins
LNHLSRSIETDDGRSTILEFEDNSNLGALFGQHDENLARIEQVIGVEIASRGNRLVIEGTDNDCKAAARVLQLLHERVAGGLNTDLSALDGLIRMQAPDAAANMRKKRRGKKAKSSDASMIKEISIKTRKKVITPYSPAQAHYMRCLASDDLVFAAGPAGTGKTYLAVAMAVEKMAAGDVERIILSRPAVEAGENLGFLPGDMREKVDPYLRPLYDALYDMLPADIVERKFENGEIEVAPLAFMRGRTLSNAYIILDEAQNTTPVQMKMFLTRFGENSHMVVAGDPSQVDLPRGQKSGLAHALDTLKGVDGVSSVFFTEHDVVRHPLVGRIVAAYKDNPVGGK